MLYDIRWYMRSIIWYNMIWYEMIWCNITWYHIIYLIMWYHLMMYDSIWYKYVTTCASRPPSLDVSLSRSQGSDVEFAGESPSIAPTETALCGQGGRFFEPSQILGGSFLELVMVMMGGGQLFFWSDSCLFSEVNSRKCRQKEMRDASLFTGSGLIFSAFQHLQRGSHVTSVMLSRLRGVTYPLFSKEKGPKLRWYSFLYKQTSLSYSKRLPWKIRVNYIELQDCNF